MPKIVRDGHLIGKMLLGFGRQLYIAFALIVLGSVANKAPTECDYNARFEGKSTLAYAEVAGDETTRKNLWQCPSTSNPSDKGAHCSMGATLAAGSMVAIAGTYNGWSHAQSIGKENISVGWLGSDDLQNKREVVKGRIHRLSNQSSSCL